MPVTTLKAAKAELAAIGVTLTKKDGEHRVNLAGGLEASAYYTDNLTDAVATGKKMRKQGAVVRPYTWKICILPDCEEPAVKGMKYCAAHQQRANGQTLAEKVKEQRAATAQANIDASDTATILAALRLFQRTYEGCDSATIARDFPEHFTEGMQSVQPWPLGTEDIDDLCERINLDPCGFYSPTLGRTDPNVYDVDELRRKLAHAHQEAR
jgi:hypothetical protein